MGKEQKVMKGMRFQIYDSGMVHIHPPEEKDVFHADGRKILEQLELWLNGDFEIKFQGTSGTYETHVYSGLVTHRFGKKGYNTFKEEVKVPWRETFDFFEKFRDELEKQLGKINGKLVKEMTLDP